MASGMVQPLYLVDISAGEKRVIYDIEWNENILNKE